MRKLIFVSTGRCGTARMTEILREKLPVDRYAIVHQMRFSRVANIVGNILYYCGESDLLKRFLYSLIISKHQKGRFFISMDPLTSMIIPNKYVTSSDVCLVHIVRDDRSFAKSMFSFTRLRLKSFIAHNFIPLWLPSLWLFENLFSRNILKKYEKVSVIKNKFFYDRYHHSTNYRQVKMNDMFTKNVLQEIVNECFDENITISAEDLNIKTNESK